MKAHGNVLDLEQNTLSYAAKARLATTAYMTLCVGTVIMVRTCLENTVAFVNTGALADPDTDQRRPPRCVD